MYTDASLVLVEADQLATLGSMAEAASDYVAAARSERTRHLYRCEWEAFTTWCARHGLTPLPAKPESVAVYIASRAQAGRKVSTIALALAAISQAHQMAGHESPRSSSAVREAFKGIRRTHGSAPTQKAPVLASQLARIVSCLPATAIGTRDRALLLVGFAGAFRRSELVALQLSDLAFDEDGVTVTLRRSKTDQEGQGRKVGIPHGSAPGVCPVRALRKWIECGGIASGAVFRSVDRHGRVGSPLAGRDVARIVKRRAEAAGLDPCTVSGHSLRAGLVTSAAKAGKAAHVIMKQTGHKSVAMVQRYVRDAELFTDNAASGLL